MRRCISAFLVVLLLATPVAYAGIFDEAVKIRYKVIEFVKDPKLLKQYIRNEYIDPVMKKDPASRYAELRHNTGSEPAYMGEVREKLDAHFAKLNGYVLTVNESKAIAELGIREVSISIMDDSRVYYAKRIRVEGDTVRVSNGGSSHMVAISPPAARELTAMLDTILQDDWVDSAEAKQLGNWGLQKYKSGDIRGKKRDIEAILNFLLGGG